MTFTFQLISLVENGCKMNFYSAVGELALKYSLELA